MTQRVQTRPLPTPPEGSRRAAWNKSYFRDPSHFNFGTMAHGMYATRWTTGLAVLVTVTGCEYDARVAVNPPDWAEGDSAAIYAGPEILDSCEATDATLAAS